MASISLKVLVDKVNNRVVFAESDGEFVDILLSFLTLPMGTIIRRVRNQSPTAIGCMRNLYQSVENIGANDFRTTGCKSMFLYPRRASEAHCCKVKMNVDDVGFSGYYLCKFYSNNSSLSPTGHWLSYYTAGSNCRCGWPIDVVTRWGMTGGEGGGVFVKGMGSATYIISDDLQILAGSSFNTCKKLFDKLGIRDGSGLEERTVQMRMEEVLLLLNRSLLSNTPLTDVILTKRDMLKDIKIEPKENSKFYKKSKTVDEGKKMRIKHIVSKSNGKILCAEVGEDFVDLLFHFLTFPLGSVIKLCSGNSSMGCIDNLYKSVEDLSADGYIKSEECKTMLVCPKLPYHFGSSNQLLCVEEEIQPGFKWTLNYGLTIEVAGSSGGNSKTEEAPLFRVMNPKFQTSGKVVPNVFVVTDGLVVKPLSHISRLLLLTTHNVLLSDIEERYVNVGEEEALNLLKASLVSEIALNSVFNK